MDKGKVQNVQVVKGADFELSVAPSSRVYRALIGSVGTSVVWEHYDLRYDTLIPCSDPPDGVNPMRAVAFYVNNEH